jgi:hypothetical protein
MEGKDHRYCTVFAQKSPIRPQLKMPIAIAGPARMDVRIIVLLKYLAGLPELLANSSPDRYRRLQAWSTSVVVRLFELR